MFADRTNWNLAPNRLSEALAQRRSAGLPVLDLTASNPTACSFEYHGEAILKSLANPAALTYAPDPKGLLNARQAVAGYYAERGVTPLPEEIVLTTSTSEAYSFVFRVMCNPGDAVLVPAPSYPLFGFLAEINDVHLAHYPLMYDHGWQIDFHALEKAITPATRAVIVVHPNNPTGHFTSCEEAAQLAALCAPRGMALIADEVFLDFAFEADSARTFAASSQALTFTLSGISKICGLPQMKAAWVVASGPVELKVQALARLEVIADTFLSMNAPVQLALPALLATRAGFQRQVMKRLRHNLAELDRQLAAQQTCSRLKCEGGWYAVLRVPATGPDEDLAIELLTTRGVYVHPGHFYDLFSDGYLVVSLLTPERQFADGVRQLLEKLRT
jgi:aspartate/methionine/tyrosine aminotransferase